MTFTDDRVAEAAAAVHALINAAPKTPTPAEITAVMRHALAAPSAARDTYLASDWHRALENYLEACGRVGPNDDEELVVLEDRLADVVDAICAAPVRTLDDLVVRAAIGLQWWKGDINNPGCTESLVLAAVVRGVLDLAGLRFDDEGRLL
jgi:hypothetical protein